MVRTPGVSSILRVRMLTPDFGQVMVRSSGVCLLKVTLTF